MKKRISFFSNLNNLSKCIFLLLLSLSLSACFIRPYKFDMDQGNELTSAQIAEITPGMGQEQILYLLGTPLLQDVFHADRWDYIYIDKPGNGLETRRYLAIFFHNGIVDQIIYDPISPMPETS